MGGGSGAEDSRQRPVPGRSTASPGPESIDWRGCRQVGIDVSSLRHHRIPQPARQEGPCSGCAAPPDFIPGECHAAEQQSGNTGIVNFEFMVEGAERTAGLYVPPEHDSSNSWPLIVFLHGGGGNGDNNGNAVTERFNRQSLVQEIRKHPERFPAFVAFPRCPGWACGCFRGKRTTSARRLLPNAWSPRFAASGTVT